MQDQKNLFLFMFVTIGVLFVYDYFFASPQRVLEKNAALHKTNSQEDLLYPAVKVAKEVANASTREEILRKGARVFLENDFVRFSIRLQGARLDDLVLKKYKDALGAEGKEIILFSPHGTDQAYYVDFGWLSQEQEKEFFPQMDSVWSVVEQLPDSVTLRWENPQGVLFLRRIFIDDRYLVQYQDTIENTTSRLIDVNAYGLMRRVEPQIEGFFILHEGPVGVFHDTLEEIDYSDLRSEKIGTFAYETKKGWVGFTDKYWLSTFLLTGQDTSQGTDTRTVENLKPRLDQEVRARLFYGPSLGMYQVDVAFPSLQILPFQSLTRTHEIFVGPKDLRILQSYQKEFVLPLFDRAIDFGWLWFITVPFLQLILYFYDLLGNFGLAILAMTVLVKLALFPLVSKSYATMWRMRKLQPKIKELQERYGSDRLQLQKEIMGCYKKEKVNPVSGCLPVLLQMPIFFALYKVLYVAIEMRHSHFYLWITDLSARDSTSIFNLFGLLPFTPPGFLMIGVLALLMGTSMWVQQKLGARPTDPLQAQIMSWLPIVFTFLLASFPSGLLIYWTWNNVLSIVQQIYINRRLDKMS